jgi:hypothetical protein
VSAQTNSYGFTLLPTTGGDAGYYGRIQKWNGGADTPGSIFQISKIMATPSPTPGAPLKSGYSVQISFFGQLGCLGPTAAIAGMTGKAGVTVNTNNGTNPDGVTNNWAYGSYNGPGVKYGKFESPLDSTNNVVKKGATNMFLQSVNGRIMTAGLAASAQITLRGEDGTVYEGCVNLSTVNAPEPSSVALLAPGLIPLALVLRRRRLRTGG